MAHATRRKAPPPRSQSTACVVYTRVSSAEQVQHTSLDSQEADCRAYAARHGLTVAKLYTDAGISGKSVEARPALLEALDYCKAQRPAALLVWKLDRLARNTSEALVVRAKLRSWGVELLSATEAVGSDPAGDLVGTIILGVAEFDNRQRADRVRRGMSEVARRGGWPHRPPIGYRRAWTADHLPTLEIDGDRGRRIGDILRRYADGVLTKSALYDILQNEVGLTRGSITQSIRSPALAGLIPEAFTADGGVCRGLWEPLISVAQHQRILAAQRRQKAREPGKLRSLLQGLLVCEGCGRTMTAYNSKGHVYHKCNGGHCSISDSKARDEVCRLLSESAIPVILRELSKRVKAAARARTQSLAQIRKTAEKEAAKQKARLDRLTDLYLDGGMERAEYMERSAAIRTAISQAQAPAEDAEARTLRILRDVDAAADRLSDPVTFLTSIPEESARAVLSALFGHISVTADKKCAVKSNCAEPSIYGLLSASAAGESEWWAKKCPGLTLEDLGRLCRVVALAS